MTPDAPAADTGFLTVDQAVAAMELPRKEPEAPAEAAPAKTEATDSPAEPTAEDTTGAETQTDGDAETAESTDAEATSAEQPAPEPPKFWDAEAKKRFSELPRDLQDIVLKKEDERNAATSRKLQEAAEKQKALEAETARFTQLTSGLDPLVNQAKETFKSRWDNVDWNAVVDQYGADQALKLKYQYETEQRTLQQLETVKQQADQAQFQRFVAEESAKLPELAPDLADPKLGPERREKLGKFLVGLGIPTQAIPRMTAVEAAIAYDAMRWRNGQATATKLVNAPKPAAPVKQTPAKPTAAASAGTTQQARIATLSKKRELSIDEAVELATLKETAA